MAIIIGLERVSPSLKQSIDSPCAVCQGCIVQGGATTEVSSGAQPGAELILSRDLKKNKKTFKVLPK
jgi:hypothetical protein